MQLSIFGEQPTMPKPTPGRFLVKYRKDKSGPLLDSQSFEQKPLVAKLHGHAQKHGYTIIEIYDEQKPKTWTRKTWNGKAWCTTGVLAGEAPKSPLQVATNRMLADAGYTTNVQALKKAAPAAKPEPAKIWASHKPCGVTRAEEYNGDKELCYQCGELADWLIKDSREHLVDSWCEEHLPKKFRRAATKKPRTPKTAKPKFRPNTAETKSCPACGKVGPIDTDFGWRTMPGPGGKPVRRPQSRCKKCR